MGELRGHALTSEACREIPFVDGIDMITERVAGLADFAALWTGNAGVVEVERLHVPDDVILATSLPAYHTAPQAGPVLLHNCRYQVAYGRVQFGRRGCEGVACNR